MSQAAVELIVRSQLIPLDGMYLVLPNTAIAEVISYTVPDEVDNSADWLLGHINWRGLTIPLISFEKASNDADSKPGKRSRIIVLNSVSDNDNLPFYAILAQGIPRLISLNEGSIHDAPEIESLPQHFVLRHVIIDSQPVLIPDQEAIEKAVISA